MAEDAVRIVLPEDASPELIERVREAFPEALPDAAPAADPTAEDRFSLAEDALADAVAAAPSLPERIAEWWAGLPGGGFWFLLTLAAILAVAYGVERAARLLAPTDPTDAETGAPFRTRLPRAARWLAGRALGLALFAVVATLLGRLLLPAGDYWTRVFAREVLHVAVYARAIYALLKGLAAPGAPGRRAMGFTEDEARRTLRAGLVVALAAGGVGVVHAVFAAAGGFGDSATLARLALILVSGVVNAWFFLRMDRPVAALLARSAGEAPSGWLGALARNWALVFVAIIAIDVLLKLIGVLGLIGPGARGGTGPTILIMAMTPLAVAGLMVWRKERAGRGWPGLFALAEGALIVGAAILLLRAWGVDPFAAPPPSAGPLARFLPGLVEATMVLVVGVALARAVDALLAGGAKAEEGALVDEEKVGGATRLETVLPILRGFALAVIAVVAGLMALSALGVDTAPLLAGAGVLGLALGFGAQRLVADVISGLFYLYEDAFRQGEYIETKSGKGVVEKISLRSVRLRHHRGPVFTIPFSDMGTIQNHSRDWVKIKFTFLVPEDTDVETVRKLVKKIGQELEQDPELEGKFLEPLKSQGAIGIQGRAFEIGCKFTSRPGQQFLIRRKAYAALQKALHEKGIELFAPQLTLTEDPARPVQPAAKAAS